MSELTYGMWMVKVDSILWNTLGITTADLADFNSRDLYDDGASPLEGAQACLDEDDMGMDFSL